MADFLLLPETVRVDYLYSRLRPCLLDLLLLDPKLFPCKRNGHGGSGSNSHTSVISLANGTVVSQKEGSKSADKGPANKVTRGSGSGNVTSIQEEEEEERRDSVSSSLNNHLQMSLCSHDVRLQGFLYSLMKEVEVRALFGVWIVCYYHDDNEYTNTTSASASYSFYSYTPHFPSPSPAFTIPLL